MNKIECLHELFSKACPEFSGADYKCNTKVRIHISRHTYPLIPRARNLVGATILEKHHEQD